LTSVEGGEFTEIPNVYKLNQNYPNPFNPETKIQFSIPVSGFTTLKIYDIRGREISELISSRLNAGVYNVSWDGKNFPSGLFL